jgi:DNA-3-methyladenine glycosylase I
MQCGRPVFVFVRSRAASLGCTRRAARKAQNERTTAKMNPPSANRIRCRWASSEPNIAYHDEEWGVPIHDDRTWFEFLTLEGAQAGLSWETVLKKRDRYRKVFANFDPKKVARFNAKRKKALLGDPGIIRNRLKIDSTITNAQAFLKVQKEFGSFDAYIWRFVDGKPRQNGRKALANLPARTPESDALSKDLQKRGFRFVGSTICYALMQATGLVNDHMVDCFRYAELNDD